MKWEACWGGKNFADFLRKIAEDPEGRDVELYLVFNTDKMICELSLTLEGDAQGTTEIAWDKGLAMLEKDGCNDIEAVDKLYDYV